MLKEYYGREAWFEGGERGGYVSYDEQTAQLLPLFECILDGFGTRGDGLSILDLGCGYGSHLALAYERGWRCFGVEVSDRARRVIAKRHGQKLFVVADVEHLIPHEFDLIVMLDVLEHLPDPYVVFYALFAKGAITSKTKVVITTPNSRAAGAIADPVGWPFRHPPSHLFFFSAESLIRMLRTLRFNSIEVRGSFEPIEALNAQGYPDEASTLNTSLSGFTGLLCEASGSDFTEFMRERYVPGTWSRLAQYEHLPRYLFARDLAQGLRVLDFGCGTGYGTAILAQSAKSAVGLDIDASALDWARANHEAANVSFERRDDLGAGLPPNSFDLIVCFEMIEHVPEALQAKAIESFARLLHKNGVAVISTPNPDVTKLYGHNPYHIREMTEAEFGALLRAYFPHVRMLYQWVKPSVLISASSAENQRLPTCHLSWRDVPDVGEVAAVFIALCSMSPLPDVEGRCYLDFATDYIAEELNWANRVNETSLQYYEARERSASLEAQLERVQTDLMVEIDRRGAALAEQGAAIGTMQSAVFERDTRLTKLERAQTDLMSEIDRRGAALAEREAAIDTMQSAISGRDARLTELESAKTDLMAEIDRRGAALAEREAAIDTMQSAISERDARLTELESAQTDLMAEIDRRGAALAEQGAAIGPMQSAISERDARLIATDRDGWPRPFSSGHVCTNAEQHVMADHRPNSRSEEDDLAALSY